MATHWTRTALFTGHKAGVYGLRPGIEPWAFLSAGGDGIVTRWDRRMADHGEQVAGAPKAIWALYFDTARGLLLMGDSEGGLRMAHLGAGEARHIVAHQRGILHIVPLGTDRIVCSGGDGSISVWRLPGLELERQVPLSDGKVRGMALDRDASLLAVTALDGRVLLLETDHFNTLHALDAHANGASSACWHPAKPVLITGGRDGHLRFWRSDEGYRALHAVPAHRANIYTIAFSPDGQWCATASRDKSIQLWDANTFDPLQRLDARSGGHTYSVNTLLWTGDGQLLSGSDDRTVRAWSPA